MFDKDLIMSTIGKMPKDEFVAKFRAALDKSHIHYEEGHGKILWSELTPPCFEESETEMNDELNIAAAVAANKKKHLISEMAQYVQGKEISVWTLAELREWVDSGRSVHDNPWDITGEDGGPLDYLAAKEIVDEQVESNSCFRSDSLLGVLHDNADEKEARAERLSRHQERIAFVGKIETKEFSSQTIVLAKDEEDAIQQVLQKFNPDQEYGFTAADVVVYPFSAKFL